MVVTAKRGKKRSFVTLNTSLLLHCEPHPPLLTALVPKLLIITPCIRSLCMRRLQGLAECSEKWLCTDKSKVCIYRSQVAHQTRACPCFWGTEQLGVFLLPLYEMPVHHRVTPSIKFASTNLLLPEREGSTGENCPEAVAVQTKRIQKRPRANISQYGSS